MYLRRNSLDNTVVCALVCHILGKALRILVASS